jgi:hypothetical protein
MDVVAVPGVGSGIAVNSSRTGPVLALFLLRAISKDFKTEISGLEV